MRWLWTQALDALAYWVLPFITFLLPARLAHGFARWLARRRWLYRNHAERALANVTATAPVDDPAAWQTTFRLVRFLDAVDCWHGRYSSDRRILAGLVTDPEQWPEAESLVLLGTHLGPSTLFLRRVAAAGYRPRFVFRDLPTSLRQEAPVYYAYLKWRVAYLSRVCEGREIRVPGGRAEVETALDETQTALILLIDAPSGARGSVALTVRGRRLPIDTGGLDLAVTRNAPGAFFAMFWDDEARRRVIEVSEARPMHDRNEILGEFEPFLERWLEAHPAQWQLWLTAQPVLGAPD